MASYDEARANGIAAPAADPVRRAPKKSSDGKFVGRRTKKPKLLAVVNGACTGCSGAPVCQIYCPVEDCMLLVPANDAFPFGRIWVDPLKCVGCKKCISRGPEDTYLDGCPWDAIVMVPTNEWEKQHGTLAF
jgi:ferredoxin